MGLVFYNGKFRTDNKLRRIEKGVKEAEVLRLLRSFLDEAEPRLVYFLVNTWRHQGKAITYKELREAILSGDISADLLDEWQQDYAQFVADHLQPAWQEAMAAAVKEMEGKFAWYFDPFSDGVRSWVETRAAEFVANTTAVQISGLRAVIQRAAVLEDMSVDQLARAIRPMVGLTKQQTRANLNYYQSLLDNGVSEKRALDLSTRHASRLHRSRAYTIARTELASAYNAGAHEGTKQAQAAGYMGEVVKEWSTADDERVCPICNGLDKTQIGMDEEFTGMSGSWSTKLHPPAHPGCRCAVKYVEVSPPIFE